MLRTLLTLLFFATTLFAAEELNVSLKGDFIDSMLEINEESNTTMVKTFALSGVIDQINNIEAVTPLNTLLAYIHTDVGRLSLFILVVLLSFLLKDIGQIIFPALAKIFQTTDENPHDTTIDDFKTLKEPLAFLIKIFGINLAIDILFYPSDAHRIIEIGLYVAYLIGFMRLFMVFTEIFFNLYFTNTYKKRNIEFRKELVNLIKQIIKAIIFIIAFLLFLRKMDVDITGFVASLGLGGLVIAMASKDTISNFFGSLKIIFDEAFSQGDWIKVGDVEGTVVEMGFISTKIRTFDNALISLPNASLANESVKNWNRRKVGRRIKMHVGVTYSAERQALIQAVDAIREMLIAHPEIATPEKIQSYGRRSSLVEKNDQLGIKSTLMVHVDSFGNSSINILIYAFSKTTDWAKWLEIKEDVMMKIWEILDNHNLEIAFPTQTIHIKKEE